MFKFVVGGDDFSNLKDKQVIVVEDIVDTGNTMRKLMNVLSKFEPASVKGSTTLMVISKINYLQWYRCCQNEHL